jgi:hypothetical protein
VRAWTYRLILAVALLGAGFWSWHWLFPSPEQVIRKRLIQLAAVACIPPNEAPLAKIANAHKLASFFSEDVEVSLSPGGYSPLNVSGREELLQMAIGARSTLGSLKVEFPDIVVSLGPDKSSATVDLTAKAMVPSEKDFGVQELRVSIKKVGGDWLITRVETVKTLL